MKPSPNSWNHVLTLMASVILADGFELENEVQSFVKNSRLLADEIGQSFDMSDDFLKQWFNIKKGNIVETMNGPNFDTFIMTTVIALEEFPNRQALLNRLINISKSDADIDRGEAAIVNLAAAYWGLSPLRT